MILSRSGRRELKIRKLVNQSQATDVGAWTGEQRKGLSLAYKVTGEGLVSVKVRAKLRCNLKCLVAVLADYDGFVNWVPNCVEVKTWKSYTTAAAFIVYIADMPWPIRKRETAVYCAGCDALDEMGSVFLFVRSPMPHEKNCLNNPVPPPLKKIPRITKSFITFQLKPIDENMTSLEMHCMMDAGISPRLLKPLIPWLVKNVVVDFFAKIVKLAIATDFQKLPPRIERLRDFFEALQTRARACIQRRLQATEAEQRRGAAGRGSSSAPSRPPPTAALLGSPNGLERQPSKEESKPPQILAGTDFDLNDSTWFRKLPTFQT